MCYTCVNEAIYSFIVMLMCLAIINGARPWTLAAAIVGKALFPLFQSTLVPFN